MAPLGGSGAGAGRDLGTSATAAPRMRAVPATPAPATPAPRDAGTGGRQQELAGRSGRVPGQRVWSLPACGLAAFNPWAGPEQGRIRAGQRQTLRPHHL
jgi:hypothetical protein